MDGVWSSKWSNQIQAEEKTNKNFTKQLWKENHNKGKLKIDTLSIFNILSDKHQGVFSQTNFNCKSKGAVMTISWKKNCNYLCFQQTASLQEKIIEFSFFYSLMRERS